MAIHHHRLKRAFCFLPLLCILNMFAAEPVLQITLDPEHPEKSIGMIDEHTFTVGLGRKGVTPAGNKFIPDHSLLGRFKINAILTDDRFEMSPDLIKSSGKTEAWLRTNLFKNMSSIDFDGDKQGGEYGEAVISLTPLDSKAKQPFRWHTYKGTFRWYSYALHGTQDQSRIGKCATGGCINIGKEDLQKLLPQLKLNDKVEISLASKTTEEERSPR